MTAALASEIVAAESGFLGADAARVALEFHARGALVLATESRDLARKTRSPRLRALSRKTMRAAALRWRMYAKDSARVA